MLTHPLQYGVVKVVVTDGAGAPMPGLHLTLFTGQRPMGYAYTGADGSYRFEDVPAGPMYSVAINRPEFYADYVQPFDSSIYFAPAFAMRPSAVDTVAAQFRRCAGKFRVVARDDASRPVPGVIATLDSADGRDFGLPPLVTGPDGTAVTQDLRCAFIFGFSNVAPSGYTLGSTTRVNDLRVVNGSTIDVPVLLHAQP